MLFLTQIFFQLISIYYLHIVIKSCQTFNEQVNAFVSKFVATSNEEIERFIKVKIIVT